MKKKLTRVLAFVIILAVALTGQTVWSFAAGNTIPVNEPERIMTIESDTSPESNGHKYTNLSAMAYADNANCLYTVKVLDAYGISGGYFYYVPNINDTGTYRRFYIQFVGHGNGMTVTSSYIYILAHSEIDNPNSPVGQTSSATDNKIIRIPRSYIHSLANGSTITSSNYTIFTAKLNKNGVLTPFDKRLGNITRYNSNNSFLINYKMPGVHGGYSFTTARLQTINGNEEFIVSEDPNDMFIVTKVLPTTYVTHPDIAYSPSCGLFIPKWYGAQKKVNGVYTIDEQYYNPCKNVIMWANIVNGEYTYKEVIFEAGTQNEHTEYIREYTPDKIVVNVSNLMENGIKKYNHFEIEGTAIDHDANGQGRADLLLSVNVTSSLAANNKDGIFRLTRTNNGSFTVTSNS